VVFPEATVKVYLDARPEVRAQRRADQTGAEHAGVLAELRARDERDSTREASPLIIPEGAVIIDTSDMTVDEVVDTIVGLARESAG
jgi:cytidylate kinase